MIKGLTHDEDGILNEITKYRGKISTGWSPNEGPNKTNAPAAAGYFRMLKEVNITKRVAGKEFIDKDWVINEPVQKSLETACKGSIRPTMVEIVCMYQTPEEMWESSLAMYSGTEGLLCKSHGKGTTARFLTFDGAGDRKWIDRQFEGGAGCPYQDCPDFKAGKCKAIGLLKCFPMIDLAPNPYRFETRSINTIIGFESSFKTIMRLINAAHAVRCLEAKKQIPFDGLFGVKLRLVHRKIKSGGRQVFITDLLPTPEFVQMVMEPIKRGLLKKVIDATIAGSTGMSMLSSAGNTLLQGPVPTDAEVVPMDIVDQQEIVVNFGADSDEIAPEEETSPTQNIHPESQQKAGEALIDK